MVQIIARDQGTDHREAAGLIKLDEATRLLAEVRTIDDAKALADKARAAEVWAARAKKGLLAQNYAAEVRIRAERMAGQFLAELERGHGPGRGKKRDTKSVNVSELKQVMGKVGISPNEVSQWQRLAKIEPKELDSRIKTFTEKAERLTTTGILATTASAGFDGDEWSTPIAIADKARRVLGGAIELDPASTAKANARIKAKMFFTKAQDGLARNWIAETLFLNPPYSSPLCQKFIEKLVHHRAAGEVKRAVLLVNAQTDPAWFHLLVEAGALVCFTRGRIGFVNPETGEESDGNRVGQAIFFFGCDYRQVVAEFADLGTVMARVKA